LPNHQAWKFEYDNTPSPGQNYGDLTKVILPSGGSISYTYSLSTVVGTTTSMWVSSRIVKARDTDASGSLWKYDYSGAPTTVTVTDPLLNDTVHGFSALATNFYRESSTKWYSGSHTSGTLLKSTTTGYQFEPIYVNGQDPAAGEYVVFPNSEVTALGNSVTETDTQYAPSFTASWGPGYSGTVTYGRPSDVKVYDYGSGSKGALLSETTTTYQFQSTGTSYLVNNLINLVSAQDISNGNGIHLSNTQYGYDDPAYLTASYLGTPLQLSSTILTSKRGNVTSTTRWLNGGTSPVIHRNWYDSGEPYIDEDAKSVSAAKYTYSSSIYWGGLPTSVTNAKNQITNYGYDAFDVGLTTSIKDPNQQTTNYDYDEMQRPLSVGYPDGGSVNYSYNDTPSTSPSSTTPSVAVTRAITTSQNLTQTGIVDGLGREIKTQLTSDPSGTDSSDTTYDSLGRVQSVSNAYRSTSDTTYGITSYLYDALGRKTFQCQPDNSSTATTQCTPGSSYQKWTYAGNAVTFQDESGNQWTRTSDALGRLTQVLEPDGTHPTPSMETDYGYDALGNLQAVKQWGGPSGTAGYETRSFTYDTLSRLLTAFNPETGTTCYGTMSGSNCVNGYDANGNLGYKTDARGILTTFGYDHLNRLTSKTYSDGTPAAHFNYDEASVTVGSSTNPIVNGIGRMTSWYVGSSEPGFAMKSFSYDPVGRPVSSYECWGATECALANGTLNHWRNYDLAGNVTVMNNSADRSYLYTYNAAGQVTSSASKYDTNAPQTLIASLTYAPSGQPVQRNGMESWSYDKRWRLLSHSQNHGSTIIYGDSLDYQPNGNVTSATETVEGFSWSWQYGYDTLNRLTSAVSTPTIPINNGVAESCAYSYDSFGNRTEEMPTGSGICLSPPTNSFTNNRIANNGFQYDAAGDVTFDGTNHYTYDAEGRIAMVTAPGNLVTSNVYGADGKRVEKQPPSGLLYYDGSLTAIYALSGSTLTPTTEDVWLNGGHLGFMGGTANSGLDRSALDWVGSVRTRVDPSANIISADWNLPFGDEQTQVSSTFPSWGDQYDTIHFTGKERDSQSGNDYFGARYYASSMGRFLSPDPYNAILIKQGMKAGGLPVEAADSFFNGFLEDPQNLNQYSYVRNNPLRLIDPTGSAPVDGHHLIPDRNSVGPAGTLARDFANNIKTGPLSGNGFPNQPGFNTAHREYNDAVKEMLARAEEAEGPSENWDINKWKDFATKVLNSDEPAIKDFLDELEQNNPGAKAALGASIAAYRVSASLIARAVAAIVVADTEAFFGDLFICATCNLHESVTHKIIYNPSP
jgi:RHS repeat-associated protein